ncbi:MAG TPA: FG-GAP repeat protein, partial [Patescibacteria group bacterium]|nr:FG-GAP repeat protein [Patescibacteria group bacterium]
MRAAAAATLLFMIAPGAFPAAAPGVIDLKRPDTGAAVTVLATIGGGEPLEWGGTRLAGGDINGDGIADLVIASPGGAEDRPSRRGRLYVKFGSVAPLGPSLDRTLHRLRTPPGTPAAFTSGADVIVEGWDDFDHLGRALAVADIDADGFADIIAGAPRADGPGNARPDCGEVYVIHGASTLPRVIELSAGPAPGVRVNIIMGRAPGDALGSSLEVADVNGDGALDVVAGAPLAAGMVGALGAINVGEVFVLSGGQAMPALIDLAAPPAGAVISELRGADPGDQVGSAVAVGDFDGDSVADLAIGARGGDGPGNRRPDAGEVYLVFGARTISRLILLGMQSEAFIAPAGIGDGGGGSLAFGDVNGDGRADLAIGAPIPVDVTKGKT